MHQVHIKSIQDKVNSPKGDENWKMKKYLDINQFQENFKENHPYLNWKPTTPLFNSNHFLVACLRTIKVKDKYELLNHDDHHRIISQSKEKLSARPDILYQTLITLQDSPLNKAGKLQIYIHTETNVLIQVNPKLHVPRTFHRFKKLMVQLLKNLTIRSTNNSEILLKVIKNPVTKYLPTGCPIIGCSHSSDSLIDLHEFVPKLPKGPIIFILGAMAHGAIDTSYSETTISFSQFPLSASVACGKICFAFEHLWEIL